MRFPFDQLAPVGTSRRTTLDTPVRPIVNAHLAREGEADRSERIGEQVLDSIETIGRVHAESYVTLRDFMSPGAWAERQAKHRAVRNVLDRFEPSMVVTEELLDELIAAADTGI